MGGQAEGRGGRHEAQATGMGKEILRGGVPGMPSVLGKPQAYLRDQGNWGRLFPPPGRDSPDLTNIPEATFPPTAHSGASTSLPLWPACRQDANLARIMRAGPVQAPGQGGPSPLWASAFWSLICAVGLTTPGPATGRGTWGKQTALSRGGPAAEAPLSASGVSWLLSLKTLEPKQDEETSLGQRLTPYPSALGIGGEGHCQKPPGGRPAVGPPLGLQGPT